MKTIRFFSLLLGAALLAGNAAAEVPEVKGQAYRMPMNAWLTFAKDFDDKDLRSVHRGVCNAVKRAPADAEFQGLAAGRHELYPELESLWKRLIGDYLANCRNWSFNSRSCPQVEARAKSRFGVDYKSFRRDSIDLHAAEVAKAMARSEHKKLRAMRAHCAKIGSIREGK